MSRPDIEILLDRYLKGTISPDERKLVENWLDDHNQVNTEWQNLDNTAREQWLAGLFADVEETVGLNGRIIPIRHNRFRWQSIAAIAACVAIFVTLFLERTDIYHSFTHDSLVTVNAPAEQKMEITLSDGSSVWINAGSELKYPKAFNGKTREVYLSGEAYFDIKHSASKSFIVHTGKIITTVLGTAFNINAPNTSEKVIITVTSGKVSVSNQKQLIAFLTPNQQITYNTKGDTHTEEVVDVSEAIAWQQSDMHFEDITFQEAAKTLEQRFKLKILFANDKIKNCRFSGTALKGNNIDQILRVLCAFNKASYRYSTNNIIIVDGAGCD
jgi:transmembrane sensor